MACVTSGCLSTSNVCNGVNGTCIGDYSTVNLNNYIGRVVSVCEVLFGYLGVSPTVSHCSPLSRVHVCVSVCVCGQQRTTMEEVLHTPTCAQR
jgi:hypothetical protein